MIDDEGNPLTDVQLLDRVQAIGALIVRRGPVESVDFATWRRQLRRSARTRGFRIAVNQIDASTVLISNPDHVITEEQRSEAIRRMSTHPSMNTSPSRPALRLVDASPADRPVPKRRGVTRSMPPN